MSETYMGVAEMRERVKEMRNLPAEELRFAAKLLVREIGRIRLGDDVPHYTGTVWRDPKQKFLFPGDCWTFGLVCILPEWKELATARYADLMGEKA